MRILMFVVLCSAAVTQAEETSKSQRLRDSVRDFMGRMHKAQMNWDSDDYVNEYMEFYAADAATIDDQGAVHTGKKAIRELVSVNHDFLRQVMQGDVQIKTFANDVTFKRLSNRKVLLVQDHELIIKRAGQSTGQATFISHTLTSILEKRGGTWSIVFEQATRSKTSPSHTAGANDRFQEVRNALQ